MAKVRREAARAGTALRRAVLDFLLTGPERPERGIAVGSGRGGKG